VQNKRIPAIEFNLITEAHPGIVYHLGKTTLGLSGSWYTRTMNSHTPLKATGPDPLHATGSRLLPSRGKYFIILPVVHRKDSRALQVSHETGNMFFLAEVNYDHFNEEVRSGSTFRLIDGINRH
jgi:hypothetical protein